MGRRFKKSTKKYDNDLVKAVINDAIISKLAGIPSKEEVNIDNPTSSYKIRIDAQMTTLSNMMLLEAICGDRTDVNRPTIVIITNKKKALKLKNNEIFSYLAVMSHNFKYAFRLLEIDWDALNLRDDSKDTNVMFLPNISIYSKTKDKKQDENLMINVLIVSVPSIGNINDEGYTDPSVEAYINRIISDVYDSAIRCGCKSLILLPYQIKFMEEDYRDITAQIWLDKLSDKRVLENIKTTKFIINNPLAYTTFCNHIPDEILQTMLDEIKFRYKPTHVMTF